MIIDQEIEGTLTLKAEVNNQKIEYHDADYKAKIENFKLKNEMQKIEVLFVPVSKAEYYQFKYLYGYLYPSCSHYMGEKNIGYVDFFFKQKFMYVKLETADDISSIPKKYFRGDTCFIKEKLIMIDKETGEIKQDKDGNDIYEYQIVGVIPSKTALDFKEMSEYICSIEEFLINELNGAVLGNQKEIAEMKLHMIGDSFEKKID